MIYHIFISHAWHRSEHYKKVVDWFDKSSLTYLNYSIPEEDPLHSGNKTQLKKDLTNQIKPASCIIVLGGMYAAYSEWIEYEIKEASRMGKYIIGVRPWGSERMPQIIQDHADDIVGWNSLSVINAVRNA